MGTNTEKVGDFLGLAEILFKWFKKWKLAYFVKSQRESRYKTIEEPLDSKKQHTVKFLWFIQNAEVSEKERNPLGKNINYVYKTNLDMMGTVPKIILISL